MGPPPSPDWANGSPRRDITEKCVARAALVSRGGILMRKIAGLAFPDAKSFARERGLSREARFCRRCIGAVAENGSMKNLNEGVDCV